MTHRIQSVLVTGANGIGHALVSEPDIGVNGIGHVYTPAVTHSTALQPPDPD